MIENILNYKIHSEEKVDVNIYQESYIDIEKEKN